MSAAPFRLLAVERIHRVPASMTVDVPEIGAFVALDGGTGDGSPPAGDSADAGAVGILFIHPHSCAGAMMTPDQADALAATLREMAAEVRAAAFSTATDALRKAARG